MNKVNRHVGLAFLLAAMLCAMPAAAYWSPEGTVLSIALGDQEDAKVVSDGAGGAIVVWKDLRGSNYDIYAQRVNASGVALWATDGVVVCSASGNQYVPGITADGAGGAIITWQDFRGLSSDIYAQRVNASGATLWQANGVALCADSSIQYEPVIASDGSGGAIVAWQDFRNGNYDIYARRINSSGTPLWTANGLALTTALGEQSQAEIISDGAGGAIVAWGDARNLNYDIFAQRVTGYGAAVWASGGVAICTAAENQLEPSLASDGAAGVIISWCDYRSGELDLYAQRVNASGVAQWTAGGVPICLATGSQENLNAVADGAGGAVFSWQDLRNSYYDIYAQKVNATGLVQWAADGIPVCAAANNQYGSEIISCDDGGFIFAWNDYRSLMPSPDAYIQKLDSAGVAQWTVDGLLLCTSAGSQGSPVLAADGTGGAVAAWVDYRNGNRDIYAQLVDGQARIGFLAPEIHAVRDIPGDQGGLVNLTWYAARSDLFGDGAVSEYSIWRAIDAAKAASSGVPFLTDLSLLDTASMSPVIRVEQTADKTYFWQFIQTVNAMYWPAYGQPVPTLFDSTAVCTDLNYYQVVAHSDVPSVFWTSAAVGGRSVDNLAPLMPTNILAGYLAEGVALDWDDAPEADFRSFLVFRGTEQGFVPSSANLVQEVVGSEWTDPDANPWAHYYKIITVDRSGNESPAGSPQAVSGVTGGELPAATVLLGAAPNPFNPSSRLSFDLAVAGAARLKIYDTAGRLVTTLVDGFCAAGRHKVTWNGRDAAGRQVASGVYLYRLEAGGLVLSRSMALVK